MPRDKTRHRRSQWKASTPATTQCSNRACRETKPLHTACPACGQYNGRQITNPA
jgi:large subunit ribosomal protein L32